MILKKWIYLLICFLTLISFGQTKPVKESHFYHLSKTDGLSHNNVTDIIKDKQGFYWIGTFNGLNRFDGTNFKKFYYSEKDSTSLSHNHILDLEEDNFGNIWIGTMHGLCKFDKKTGDFKRFLFHNPKTTDELVNRIYNLAKDKKGDIWFSSWGLRRISPVDNSQVFFEFDANNNNSPAKFSRIYFYGYDSKLNGIWLQTDGVLNFFDINKNSFYHSKNNSLNWSLFNEKNNINLSINGNGKVIFPLENNTFKVYNVLNNVPQNYKLSINEPFQNVKYLDKNNIIFFFKNHLPVQYNLSSNKIIDLKIPDFYTQTLNNYFLPNNVFVIKSNIYATTNGVYIQKKSKSYVANFEVDLNLKKQLHTFQVIASAETILMGTSQGLFEFNILNKKFASLKLPFPTEDVVAVLPYDSKTICLGTNSRLVFLDAQSHRIINFIEVFGRIIFLEKSNDGHIWVGFWRNGLAEFDKTGKLLNHYTEKNGIRYNGLVSCLKDGEKGLWVGMNEGNGFFTLILKPEKSKII